LAIGNWREQAAKHRNATGKLLVPISEREIPALFPDLFGGESRNGAKSQCLYGFRRKRWESLLNPCRGGKFADFGQNLINQTAYREKSLINSLVQGKRKQPRLAMGYWRRHGHHASQI
jgi:hypothetical protein